MNIITPPEEPRPDTIIPDEVVTVPFDERRGLPSASSFPRYSYCPASFPLEWQLRDLGQVPIDHGSEDANQGTRIHEALAKFATGAESPLSGLDRDERDTTESLWERAQSIISRTFGSVENIELIVEERHWLKDTQGNDIASGKFDLMAFDDNRGLVIDYKTLFGEHDPAPANLQLRFGAVVLAETQGIREVDIALVQRMKPNSWARLNDLDLEETLEEIDLILSRRHADPFALGFRKGPKCAHCPARLACPALQWDLAQIQTSPLALIAGATDEQLGKFLTACKSVEHLDKAATKEAEARIRSGRTVPGWKLEASAGKRQVKNARELGNRLTAAGASINTVLDNIKMSVGDAEAIHKAVTGLKGKAAAEAFNELADGTIEKTQPEPTLKRA